MNHNANTIFNYILIIHKYQSDLFCSDLRSYSIGINRFNRKWFSLMQLTFSNRTLFQPFSLETRSFLGVVITRLPFLQPFLSASSIITQLAASRASENNVQRSLPMHFQPFQPSLMRVEKVEQPNQPKTVFCK